MEVITANHVDFKFKRTSYDDKKLDYIIYETSSGIVPYDFRKALEEIKEKRYRAISLEENVLFRLLRNRKHEISQRGNLTSAAFIKFPNNDLYFVKDAIPLYENPEKIESSLENALKLSEPDFYIDTDKFATDSFTMNAFGSKAESYGEFLKGTRNPQIDKIRVRLSNSISENTDPLILPIWLSSLGYGSEILGLEEKDINFTGVRYVCDRKNQEYLIEDIMNALSRSSLPKNKIKEVIEKLEDQIPSPQLGENL